MGFLKLLNQLMAISAVLILIGACAKNAKQLGNNLAGMTPTPNSGDSDNSGGIDSSGGDPLKSTKEQVMASLQNVKEKTQDAFWRLRFAIGDLKNESTEYKLTREFVNKIKTPKIDLGGVDFDIKENDYCESKNKHKAGSAKGNLIKGEICLSVKALQEIAPEALDSQIILLTLHELSHLLGYQEEDAVKLQTFISNKINIINPNKKSVKTIKQNMESLKVHTNNLLYSFSSKEKDTNLCAKMGSLSTTLTETFELLSGDRQIIMLPPYLGINIVLVSAYAKQIQTYCGIGSDVTGVNTSENDKTTTSVASKVNDIVQDVEEYLGVMSIYLDPHSNSERFLDYTLAAGTIAYLGTEFSLSARKSIANPKLKIDPYKNVACFATMVDLNGEIGKSYLQPFTPEAVHKVYESATGRLASYDVTYADTGQTISLMIRQTENNNGVDVSIMMKDIENVDIVSGFGIVGGESYEKDGKPQLDIIPMSILYPNFNNAVQFTVKLKNQTTFNVKCQLYKDNKSLNNKMQLELKEKE